MNETPTTPPPSSSSSPPSDRATDPHASKVAQGDPRLHVRASQGRTLRKGPVVLVLAGLLGVVVLALTFALQPAAPSKAKPEASASAALQPPVIPDAIRIGQPPAGASTARTVPVHPSVRRLPMETPPPVPRMSVGRTLQRFAKQEQDQKAASAGILFEAKGELQMGAPSAPGAPAAAASPAASGAAARAAGPGGSAAGLGDDLDPNRQERKNAFLDVQGASKTSDYLVTSVQHPRSPYELKAGTIVPAVLVTGINSDLPGPVIGQVRENVYDTVTGNYLLVPQGARLIATYDSMVSWGQERVLVCWNRLIFPNGDSVNLQCMPAADLEGAAGLTDEVNEHWWRLIKGAAIATLLAATSEGLAGNVSSYNPTVPQMFAAGAGQQINQVGQQITRRDLQVQPTITVRPGFSVNVIVTKDVVLPPYAAGGSRIARAPSPARLP
jgi:type IV secretion system protein TrbI